LPVGNDIKIKHLCVVKIINHPFKTKNMKSTIEKFEGQVIKNADKIKGGGTENIKKALTEAGAEVEIK
jgi:ribosomal protein L7/L12